MPEVELKVAGQIPGYDQNALTRSLYHWLAGRDELRGRVHPCGQHTCSINDTVALVIRVGEAHPGAIDATASVLVSWIRRLNGTASVTAKRPDGAEITLTAEQGRGWTEQELKPLVERIAMALEGGEIPDLNGGDRKPGGNASTT